MQNPLAASDTRSKTWLKLRSWIEAEIGALRERNDGFHLDQVETAAIRGRIAQLLEMLSLADQASDSSEEPLVVFDSTSTSSLESALTG